MSTEGADERRVQTAILKLGVVADLSINAAYQESLLTSDRLCFR